MEKIDYRKTLKEYYRPPRNPVIVEVTLLFFSVISFS